MDSSANVSDLLRRALVVATKLKLADLRGWVQQELNGYANGDDIPDYRRVRGQIKAHNPYHGWIPVLMPDHPRSAENLSSRMIYQPIVELEQMSESDPGGVLQVPFPDDVAGRLMRSSGVPLTPTLIIPHSQVAKIVDAVRNALVEWSLRLEEKGILGDGMQFTAQEKEAAAQDRSIHITNFHGVFGNVEAESVQIGDDSSLYSRLEQQGVTSPSLGELRELVKQAEKATGDRRKSAVVRGLEWVSKNIKVLGPLATEVIGRWFSD